MEGWSAPSSFDIMLVFPACVGICSHSLSYSVDSVLCPWASRFQMVLLVHYLRPPPNSLILFLPSQYHTTTCEPPGVWGSPKQAHSFRSIFLEICTNWLYSKLTLCFQVPHKTLVPMVRSGPGPSPVPLIWFLSAAQKSCCGVWWISPFLELKASCLSLLP